MKSNTSAIIHCVLFLLLESVTGILYFLGIIPSHLPGVEYLFLIYILLYAPVIAIAFYYKSRNSGRKIVSVTLAGFGIYHIVLGLYGSFQHGFLLNNLEDLAISIIGLILSAAWFYPFLIISYWLYIKSKTAVPQ